MQDSWDCSQLSIKQIKQLLKRSERQNDFAIQQKIIMAALMKDRRVGVQKLYQQQLNKQRKRNQEIQRLKILHFYENEARSAGYKLIAGLDEAGRGPLAGPVVAAAVMLRPNELLEHLDDSKKLSEHMRDVLFEEITKKAVAFGIGQASCQEIDRINIYQASALAMRRALADMPLKPDYLLLDAMNIGYDSNVPEKPLIHGDALSASIAAASVLAKVTRDRMMQQYHLQYPQYNFIQHKGYGTEQHRLAIEKYGLCPLHRTTFTFKKASGIASAAKVGQNDE